MKDKKGIEKKRNQSEKYGRMVQIIPWAYICPSVVPRNTVQNMKYRIATKNPLARYGELRAKRVRYGLNTHTRTRQGLNTHIRKRQNCITFHTA